MKKYIKSEKDYSNIPEENQHGDCFVVALNKWMENPERYTLVHGVVTGQGAIDGVKYTHAWVEDGNNVIDMTLPEDMQVFPKDAYYAIGNIKITRKYKYKDVLNNVCTYETYGPWDKVFDGYF